MRDRYTSAARGGIELPVKSRQGEAHGVVWRLPAYNIVHNILTNPIYAGAYAFGRTKSRVSIEAGRKRIRRGVQKPMAEWDALIKDHHAAYITWGEFERNLRVIANNATGMSSALARGAAREGDLLLPGLLRCGHCGRKLHTHYCKLGRYNCYGARTNHGAARCISISGLSIALVRELARLMPDQQIARLLNRTGVETGHGNAWTQHRVCGFRNHHGIAASAMASGRSAARSRSKRLQNSSASAT